MAANTCKFCKLQIAPDALKCQHCLSEQQANKGTLTTLSPVLSMALALISILTFALIGLPDLLEKTFRNKAIVQARFSHGSKDAVDGKLISIVIANYGASISVVHRQIGLLYL